MCFFHFYKISQFSDVNEELFSIIKKRLFCDVFQPNEEIFSNRWIDHSQLISLQEFEEVQSILEKHFPNQENLKEQASLLISEIETLSLKISKLEQQNVPFKQFQCKFPLYSSFQSKIKEWIGQKKWSLIYKGTQDSFSSQQFHLHCDSKD